MLETALIFDLSGRTLAWHLPPGRTSTRLPDSRALWELLWQRRDEIGGVAHLHPFVGEAVPSAEPDLSTFAAIEAGLGRRLLWPILTLDDLGFYAWCGPQRLHYRRLPEAPLTLIDAERLRAPDLEVPCMPSSIPTSPG